MVFRDWLPSVIQSIEPYVSSEDIDKGARWSTDIAKELENSTFGILCVTRENINTPWLTFEAGALSKTMDKSYVSPFLFDIKRSEVDGPILQFQSTIFEEDDVKKLVKTLNKACGEENLKEDQLVKTFNVWYPTLEEELKQLITDKRELETDDNHEIQSPGTQEILEEILELSRINQKLLRNPETNLARIKEEIQYSMHKYNDILMSFKAGNTIESRFRIYPEIVEDISTFTEGVSKSDVLLGIMLALTFYRDRVPWIYDIGMEMVRTLNSKRISPTKGKIINEFSRMLDFLLSHPIMRKSFIYDDLTYKLYNDLGSLIMNAIRRLEIFEH